MKKYITSAGKRLKIAILWSPNGTDAVGFSAIPGGRRTEPPFEYFFSLGDSGYWWTANLGVRQFNNTKSEIFRNDENNYLGFSVRCVQD